MLQERADEWNSFKKRIPAAARTVQLVLWSYTDGSKSEHKVAAAAFFTKDPDNPKITRLRDGSSVFNAELEGILLSLKKILTLPQLKNFIIYTDSLSAVESLRRKTFKTKNVKRFYNLKKIPPQAQMVIAWIPSHVGISGNEKADRLAKAGLDIELGRTFAGPVGRTWNLE